MFSVRSPLENDWPRRRPPIRIELWDDKDRHVEEVIALAADYFAAERHMRKRQSAVPASSSRFAKKRG
jgi:hypothetical protein